MSAPESWVVDCSWWWWWDLSILLPRYLLPHMPHLTRWRVNCKNKKIKVYLQNVRRAIVSVIQISSFPNSMSQIIRSWWTVGGKKKLKAWATAVTTRETRNRHFRFGKVVSDDRVPYCTVCTYLRYRRSPQYTFDHNWIISPGGGESEVGVRFTFLLCWLFFFCFPQYPPPNLTWMACTLLHWSKAPTCMYLMYQWPYFLHVHFILSFWDNNVILTVPSSWKLGKTII